MKQTKINRGLKSSELADILWRRAYEYALTDIIDGDTKARAYASIDYSNTRLLGEDECIEDQDYREVGSGRMFHYMNKAGSFALVDADDRAHFVGPMDVELYPRARALLGLA